jgi:flagellin
MTPTEPNRRLAETQAFGSAVLFVGMATALAQNTIVGGGQRIDILSRGNANYALAQLDTAISAVSAERAKYGSYMSRLEHAGDNMTNVARHVEQSRSRIADADYAVETSELSRTTIIAQASTAMLAQANAAKQTVLTLLQ